MTDSIFQPYPKAYAAIDEATRSANFNMASDVLTGSLLRTLAASKPAGTFLEIGTGTGLSTSWLLDGMDASSTLISIDFDSAVIQIAQDHLGSDKRLTLVQTDGGAWLEKNQHNQFDFIFADSWHGKYLLLEKALDILKPGGIYFIDDMLPQKNWPEGHAAKADQLIDVLERRSDLRVTKLHWSTGIVIAVKK
jgi:predicted O-methyltransferase YrrM